MAPAKAGRIRSVQRRNTTAINAVVKAIDTPKRKLTPAQIAQREVARTAWKNKHIDKNGNPKTRVVRY
jgi:hypothetical protein